MKREDFRGFLVFAWIVSLIVAAWAFGCAMSEAYKRLERIETNTKIILHKLAKAGEEVKP